MGLFGFAGKRLSLTDFPKAVASEIKRLDPSCKVAVDAENFALIFEPSERRPVSLILYYEQYVQQPASVGRSATRDIASGILATEPAQTMDSVRTRLRPWVRNLSQTFNGFAASSIVEEFAGALAVGVSIDWGEGETVLTTHSAAEWGLTSRELLSMAIENVRALPRRFKREAPGYYCSDHNDHYDVARILVPEIIDELDLRGDPVAMLASRDRLFIAGSEDSAALEAMARAAGETLARAMHPVSYSPLVRRTGLWSALEETPNEPISVQTVRALQSLQDYQRQQAWLQGQKLVEPGVTLGMINVRDVADRPRTFTVWEPEGTMLLPKTDLVAVVGAQKDIVYRRWGDLEAAGAQMTPEPGF